MAFVSADAVPLMETGDALPPSSAPRPSTGTGGLTLLDVLRIVCCVLVVTLAALCLGFVIGYGKDGLHKLHKIRDGQQNHTQALDDIQQTLDKACEYAELAIVNSMTSAIDTYEAGLSIPADPIGAVGPDDGHDGRIITMTNTYTGIFDKRTNRRLSLTNNAALMNIPIGRGPDPWVVNDPYTGKFFLQALAVKDCREGLIVQTGPISGNYCTGATSTFGPQAYSTTGEVAQASPLNACSPVGASVLGKIALVIRGTCDFAIKVRNAQDAGAIGVIAFNNAGDGLINMVGTDPNITIGSVFVGQTDGTSIQANLPLTATIIAPKYFRVIGTYNGLAVSKDSLPNNAGDFNVAPSYFYPNIFADYPKTGVGRNIFVVSSQDFPTYDPPVFRFGNYFGTSKVFDKADLEAGITTLLYTRSSNVSHLPYPARTNMPASVNNHPVYTVALIFGSNGTTDNYRYKVEIAALFYSGVGGVVQVDLPEPLFGCSQREDSPFKCVSKARQPFFLGTFGLDSSYFFVVDAVVRGKSIFFAYVHNVEIVEATPIVGLPVYRNVIKWYEYDISTMLLDGNVKLVQYGTIDPGVDYDIFFPSIDVDKWNNVVVSFSISGLTLPLSMGATFRLASDPLGSMRSPIHVIEQGVKSYFEDFGGGNNRAGDYSMGRFDPNCDEPGYTKDYCDYYVGNMIPLPGGFESPAGLLRDWTTALVRIRINKLDCPPVDGNAPTDGTSTVVQLVTIDSTANESSVDALDSEELEELLRVPEQLCEELGRPCDSAEDEEGGDEPVYPKTEI